MTKNENLILSGYKDRIFKLKLKDLFLLLHDMRFCSKRTYHADGRTTLALDVSVSNRLEDVFEDRRSE